MRSYVLFDPTGKIAMSAYKADDSEIIVPAGFEYLFTDNFVTDVDNYYVNNNQLVQKPPKPNSYDEWNYAEKNWVQNYDLACQEVINKRLILLTNSDWTELKGSERRLGGSLYAQWQSYRQQLRDITEQEGYPYNVVFPAPPTK